MSDAKPWRVLANQPGSTSTKVGLFEGEGCVFSENVAHAADRLAAFPTISDQLPYRRDAILAMLSDHGVELSSIDAFVGRGGGLMSLPGGTYAVCGTTAWARPCRGQRGAAPRAARAAARARVRRGCGRQARLRGESARYRRALRRRPHDRCARRVPQRAPPCAQLEGDGHPPCGIARPGLRGLRLRGLSSRRGRLDFPRIAMAA